MIDLQPIYLLDAWIFVAAPRLSPVAARWATGVRTEAFLVPGFSCWQARAPEHVGSGNSCVSSSGAGAPDPGLLVVTCRLRCSIACGILPDQRSNPCPLHLQADSQPLSDQGSPLNTFNASIPPKLSIY